MLACMTLAIRPATEHDIPAMAALRAETWGSAAYWEIRIAGYLSGEHFPQQALRERTAFVATEDGTVVGLIAGHRTRRFGYDGELEWIDVTPERRGQGIADALFRAMAAWFIAQQSRRVCVNVAVENTAARSFYARHGAIPLQPHWMAWEDVSRR